MLLEERNKDLLNEFSEEEEYDKEVEQDMTLWERVKEWCSKIKDYETSKDVRILDRRLGFIYYGTLTFILLYLVIYVFIIAKQYLDTETVDGTVYITLLDNAYAPGSNFYVWDQPEENPWGPETSSVFVPSKIIVTRAQQSGLCADPLLYCETDSDCSPIDLPNEVETNKCANTSEGTSGCISWKWCPPENSNTSSIYYIQQASQQRIWARFRVEFERLSLESKDNYAGKIKEYPGQNSNTWKTNDILLLSGSNFSDITEKGAVIQATIVYKCIANPFEVCDTYLQVQRLDEVGSGGYSINHAEYYRNSTGLYRNLYHMKGAKILFDSKGIYVATSLFNVVLQLASALGLIVASKAITDAIMLNLLKEKSHFKQLKVKIK